MDTGIDRTLSALAGWVKTILSTEQKKTDFNPVSAKAALTTSSPACLRVVKFVNYQVSYARILGNNYYIRFYHSYSTVNLK